jgi:hypothetical protein
MDAGIRPRRAFAATLRARLVNPVVRAVLRSPWHRVLSGSMLLLAYTGRRSGICRELPAMYAVLGDRFVVVAGQPDTKTWWRNFAGERRPVTVTVAGRRERHRGRLLGTRTAGHQLAVDAYRARYPRVPVGNATPVLVLTPQHRGQRYLPTGSAAGGQPESRRVHDVAERPRLLPTASAEPGSPAPRGPRHGR